MRARTFAFILLILTALVVYRLVSYNVSYQWYHEVTSTYEGPRNGTVYVFLEGGGNTYLYLPAYINESLGSLKLRPVFIDYYNAPNETGNLLLIKVPIWAELSGFLSVTYEANVTIEYYKNVNVREVVLQYIYSSGSVEAKPVAIANLTITMRAGYRSKFDPYRELAKIVAEKTGELLRTSDEP
ncbi:hypothetical protein [Thermococcus sp.]|uniref:hypothetical protein n=2 Tax=Thermococcus sp. TaxID=35749 RepID=UPI0026363221|nr:hypothetical protein [Thermococcus sp.]